MPRPAGSRLTQQFDRQPIEVVKVSAVLVDATPELADSPVPADLAGADDDTNLMSPNLLDMSLSVRRIWPILLVLSPPEWRPRRSVMV